MVYFWNDNMEELVPAYSIHKAIHEIRGQCAMLDSDLANLYGVTTGNLNKAVKRNLDRFPEDFMFQLSDREFRDLLFQTGRANGRGGRRSPPLVFTEQGVAMLSSVLRSKQAVQVNIEIMRAFVRHRQLIGIHSELAARLDELEVKYEDHESKFEIVLRSIRELAESPKTESKNPLGFRIEKQRG